MSLFLGFWLFLTGKDLKLPDRRPFESTDDGRELIPIAILKMIGLEQGKSISVWHKKIFGVALIVIGLWLIIILFKYPFLI